jgi:hypothetical protein
MSTRYILAIDPGKATGIALFSRTDSQEPELIWSGEEQFAGYVAVVREFFSTYGDSLEVVCEKFTINMQTAKKAQAPYSLECIGALKMILLDNGRDPESLQYQLPADAMAMFTNEKLKKLGYWHRGGEGHALDAIRHALLKLAKTGWVPVRLLQT